MKNSRAAFFVVLITSIFFLFATVFSCGDEPQITEIHIAGADVNASFFLDMWHYSGGYWKVGNAGSDKIIVDDMVMQKRGMQGVLADKVAKFVVDLPGSIIDKITEGKEIKVKAVAFSTPLAELFDINTFDLRIDDGKVYFSANPWFNLISERDLSFADYNLHPSAEVPLIDRTYGYNIYSLFGNGEGGVQSAGRIDRLSPFAIEPGYVHPAMITGLDGALEGGHSIQIRGSAVGSAGYSVGSGTFAAGGAVGLSFFYPVKFQFYEVVEGEVPPVDPPDVTQTDVTAILELPAETYEGHPVAAQDVSVFEVEGEPVSAVDAYAQSLASNSFRIVESGAGQITRQSDVSAEAVFTNAGRYNVRLNVETVSGQSGQDTKSISVKRTPFISHTLSGTQKQNRKQSLFVSVAQNPLYPIQQLWIELEDPIAGETVRLVHHTDGGANTLLNSDAVKTRAIEDKGSTEYFVRVQLDFLTKNSENQDYVYRIYAQDVRGNIDSADVVFPVAKDHPPVAQIKVIPFFLRNKGTNTAQITLEDVSVTDGDQLERTWSCSLPSHEPINLTAMPGYADISFGSKKTVVFDKEGVGPFGVALEVKDVWTEETLPEYIVPSDYLTAQTSSQSEVDNVAPIVSLKTINTQTAEILVLAKDETSYNEALLGKAELANILLSESIDANITVEHVTAAGETAGGNVQNIGTLTVPYGFNGTWSGFWENGSVTSDEKQVYKAEATWTPGATGYDCYANQPYTIRAYDAKTLQEKWTYTLSAAHFPMGGDRGYSAFFGHDSENRFLYFMINGKTILLDKQTGAELAILPFLMSHENSVCGTSIFCFKGDGIYRVSMVDASVTKIFTEKIFTGVGSVKTIGGKQVFLVQRGVQLLRAAFDAESQTLSFRLLQGTAQDSGTATTYLVGIDSAGTLIINTVANNVAVLRAFDVDGKRICHKSMNIVDSYPNCMVPIYDSAGRINYIGVRTYSRSSSRKTVSVNVIGIASAYNQSVSVRHDEGYPTEIDRVLFGVEKENGTVLVGLGAQWTYIANSGYNNGPTHGMPERAKVFKFNPAENSCMEGSLSDFAPGLNSVAEYGYYSPGTVLVSTGGNHPVTSVAYHSTSVINVSQAEASQVDNFKIKHISQTSSHADYTLITEIAGAFSPQTIANELLEKTEAGKNVLVLTTETETGSISKPFDLQPGKTYYYEYKTNAKEDILVSTANYVQTGESSEIGTDRYVVKEEMFEDFNDLELNPYFSTEEDRVENGKYTAARVYLNQGSNWKNRYLAASSSIEFTVPEACKGILSFDYDILRDSGWMANFFALSKDGGAEVIWDEFVSASKQGAYTHKDLLAPGNYQLRAYARAYGGRHMDYHTKIDNLRMVLIDPLPSDDTLLGHAAMESHSSIRRVGGMNLVSGTFRSPSSVLAYSKLDAEYVEGGSTTAYSALSGEPGRYVQTVSIPAERTALYLSIDVWSSPTLTKNYNNVNFEWGGHQWSCAYNNRYPQSALTNIPRNYTLARMGLTGVQRVEQRSSTYRNAYGGFSKIRAVISNPQASVPASVLNGQFFLERDGLFFESTTFVGDGEIAFAPSAAGETQISDLKIYMIENGTRVYLEDVSLGRQAVLQQWQATDVIATVSTSKQQEEEAAALVFAKGDLISHVIFYSDYEKDPSKVSYWKYTHTPMNDGLHPLSGQVLTSPINRFYVDGKYVLEHWQEDDASRTGDSPYDKASNVCVLTFYIEGTAQAPWITYIRTNPSKVEVGDSYTLQIGVDDKDKDLLNLTTEVYFGENPGLPFFTHFMANIKADLLGRYPEIFIPVPHTAEAGRYDVVSIVRDALGAGLGTFRFYCTSPIGISGEVLHTQGWEQHRKEYNSNRSESAFRAPNVFWPGERLCLRAQVGGSPTAVSAVMLENPEYSATLSKAGPPNAAGETPYAGFIWNATMQKTLANATPILKTIRFTATYADGSLSICDVEIIFDQDQGYWRLHRLY